MTEIGSNFISQLKTPTIVSKKSLSIVISLIVFSIIVGVIWQNNQSPTLTNQSPVLNTSDDSYLICRKDAEETYAELIKVIDTNEESALNELENSEITSIIYQEISNLDSDIQTLTVEINKLDEEETTYYNRNLGNGDTEGDAFSRSLSNMVRPLSAIQKENADLNETRNEAISNQIKLYQAIYDSQNQIKSQHDDMRDEAKNDMNTEIDRCAIRFANKVSGE